MSHMLRTSFPKIALALLCGIVSTAGVGIATAATPQVDSAAISVKYDPTAIQTDTGARELYARLTDAAAALYPSSNPHWVPSQVQQLREQAIARAVAQIHSSKLDAIFNSSFKS